MTTRINRYVFDGFNILVVLIRIIYYKLPIYPCIVLRNVVYIIIYSLTLGNFNATTHLQLEVFEMLRRRGNHCSIVLRAQSK